MSSGRYVVKFSKAKDGWCVYEYTDRWCDQAIKVAGPYRERMAAEEEFERIENKKIK